MKGLENKRVVITGAAAGIGRDTARRFHAEGSDMLLVDIPTLEESELANEFSEKVDPNTVLKYKKHFEKIPTILIPHEEFKERVGQALAIIHTGDAVPYSSVILKSG